MQTEFDTHLPVVTALSHLDDTATTDLLAQSHSQIGPRMRRRIAKRRIVQDRRLSLAGYTTLIQLVARHLGRPIESISIEADATGRPFVCEEPDLRVTLSHSGTWLLAAVSDVPVGVDIEEIVAANEWRIEPALTSSERRWVRHSRGSDRPVRSTSLWVVKESYLKALGVGLRSDPKHIHVDVPRSGHAHVRDDGRPHSPFLPSARVAQFDGYVLAACILLPNDGGVPI